MAAVVGQHLDLPVPAAAVVLAIIVLRERVTRWQGIGTVLGSRNLRIPSGGALRLALTAASLEACANVTMLLALHASLLSLASVLISLYPAATVVLAMAVLRERVTRWQGVGIVLAALSVAMIASR